MFLVFDVLERTSIILVNQIRSLQFYLLCIHEAIRVLGDVLMDITLYQFQYPGQVSSRTCVSFTFKTMLARTCGPTCEDSLHGVDSIISAILNRRSVCANGINWHP